MNHAATSKEAILEKSKQLVREQGSCALNVRAVSKACGVSVGCIYNYFASKEDVTLATIESIWNEVMDPNSAQCPRQDLLACVRWIFERLAYAEQQYPGFLQAHSRELRAQDAKEGTARMQEAQSAIRSLLEDALEQDKRIGQNVLDDDLTKSDLSKTVLQSALGAIVTRDYDCKPLVELLKRALYEHV